MSKIGGYQIIDFDGFDLNTVTEDYTTARVKTSLRGVMSGKRAVLSGLTLGNERLSDITVDLVRIFGTDTTGSFLAYFLNYELNIDITDNYSRCEFRKIEEPEPAPAPIKYINMDEDGNLSGYTEKSLVESVINNPETEHIVILNKTGGYKTYFRTTNTGAMGATGGIAVVFMATEIEVFGINVGTVTEKYFLATTLGETSKVHIQNTKRETT